MNWRYFIETVAALIMVGGIGGIFYGITKNTIALSVRTIQFLAVAFALPAIMILALERALGNEAVAALFGVVIGFALIGLSKND